MALKPLLTCCLVLLTLPCAAAPPLTDADRERLADGTTDRDGDLDQQDGLYVLLRNAFSWQGEDFGGDAGAAVAPPPDYGYLKKHPEEVRGNAYLIEGWLAQHDRYPTRDNHERDALVRAGDPAWGDQVTRWIINTDKKDPSSTIIVLFNDPRAQMPKPGVESQVKVAARFYKLWTIPDVNGKPFTYPVFVGGAAEVVQAQAAGGGGGPSSGTIVMIALVLVAGGFIVIRLMLSRKGGGNMTLQRLEAMRRDREAYESETEEEEDEEVLPEDPVAALDVLRKKHDQTSIEH